MVTTWKHTDSDFTLEQLANTIAYLINSGADFNPLDTETLKEKGNE